MSFLWLGGQHRRWYLRVLNDKATKSGPPYNYSLRLVTEWARAECEHPRWHCCKKKDATTGGARLTSNYLSLPSSFRVRNYLDLLRDEDNAHQYPKTCAIFLEISLCGAAGPPLHHRTTSLQPTFGNCDSRWVETMWVLDQCIWNIFIWHLIAWAFDHPDRKSIHHCGNRRFGCTHIRVSYKRMSKTSGNSQELN